jgi:hypothetical protein
MKYLIGLPCVDGRAHIEVVSSILDQIEFITRGKHTVRCQAIKHTLIHNARNAIAAAAIQYDYDYVFFIDSDCILPPKTLEKLTGYDKDVASGMYFLKAFPFPPVIYNMNEKGSFDVISDYPEKKLIRVGAVGMGVCLIKVSALKKLGYQTKTIQEDGQDISFVETKVFDPVPETETQCGINGEDMAFCKRCSDAGIKMYVDTGIQAAHLTDRAIDERYHREAIKKFSDEERIKLFSMKPKYEV